MFSIILVCRYLVIFLSILDIIGGTKNVYNDAKHENNSRIMRRSKFLQTNCGETIYDSGTVRIIGGAEATLGQFPWMARLGVRRNNGIFFFCGGSLISNYYVISAVHCGSTGEVVRLGESYLDTYIDCDKNKCAPRYQDVGIRRYIFHENYHREDFDNDIALIELNKRVLFHDYVQPICLPVKPIPYSTFLWREVWISGWGLTKSYPRILPNRLMQATLFVLPRRNCYYAFGDFPTDRQWCIGVTKNGNSSCKGDSGGPVSTPMWINGKYRATIIGIFSYVLTTCGTGPSVYADVSKFLNWIDKKIGK